MKYLEKLRIYSDTFPKRKRLNNLNFIIALNNLKKFDTDYIIKDGNLTPLMKLDDTSILTWKKYYNLKDRDLPHKDVLYRIDNNGHFVRKKLNEIDNGKENENIIWLDSLKNN